MLARVRKLVAVLRRHKSDAVARVDVRVLVAPRDKVMVGQQNPVAALGPNAVADRTLPEIGADQIVLGRIVIPLLQFADRRDAADADDDPLIVVGQRRALRINEHQTLLRLERSEERVEQRLLIGVTLYPGPLAQPVRIFRLIFGMRVDAVPLDDRLAVDLPLGPFAAPRPFLQKPTEGRCGGRERGMDERRVADVFVILARLRISVTRDPPLRLRRKKIHPLGKTGRDVFVRNIGEELSRVAVFHHFVFRRADPVKGEAARILTREAADSAVPSRVVPWHAHRQVAKRDSRDGISRFLALFSPERFCQATPPPAPGQMENCRASDKAATARAA